MEVHIYGYTASFPYDLGNTHTAFMRCCIFYQGKNLDFIAMILTALCVISYIQNAFLNVSTFINGAQENASDTLTSINLLLWLGIIVLIPYIIYCCYNKSMKNILRICSAATGLLLIMQGSALSYMMINGLSESNPVKNRLYPERCGTVRGIVKRKRHRLYNGYLLFGLL